MCWDARKPVFGSEDHLCKSLFSHNPEYCSGRGVACLGLDDNGDL